MDVLTIARLQPRQGRNQGKVLLAIFNVRQWPVRILKHRGWHRATALVHRRLSAAESEWLAQQYRYQAFTYTSWGELIDDEQRAYPSAPYLARLQELQQEHSDLPAWPPAPHGQLSLEL